MKNIGIYVVSLVVSYEGPVAQHVFPSESSALAAFDKLAASARAGQLEYGASVVLSGPFEPGDDILNAADKEKAVCDPVAEAKVARAAQRKAKAKDKKPAKPADCYAAMRMADGG
jgi:hypothetical protein